MHYFIFPEKDSTIYEDSVTQNAGLDQILELEKRLVHTKGDVPWNSRILIKFDLDDFSASLATGELSGSDMRYYLNLFTSEAVEIPLSYDVFAYPISQSWEMGTGKRGDSPINTTGVSWNMRDGITLSGISGSTWATTGSDFISGSGYEASQSFDFQTTDLHLDVTTLVESWLDGTIDNHGILIKRSDSAEKSILNQGNLQFFSNETHTIYRPRLEIIWKDFSYSPYTSTTTSQSISSSFDVDTRITTPILPYTTTTNYTGSGIGTGSGYFTQSVDLNTWYSESYSWVTESIWSYTSSLGLYHSSSAAYTYTTASFNTYISSSISWVSYSLAETITIVDFYTGSLGAEYESGSVYFSTGSMTSSDATWIYDTTAGYYYSQSLSPVNYTWTSSSLSSSISSSATDTLLMNPITNEDYVFYVSNMYEEYRQNSKVRFRIKARERYPRKTFVTESWEYTTNEKFPPTQSYYAIRDGWTETEWMPFSSYTQLSVDTSGSYFDLYLNGLEPERFYRLMFKVTQGGIEKIIDNDNMFRIVR